VEEVLRLYGDLLRSEHPHFHEKLREQHKIKLSYTFVQQALQGAGLVARGKNAASIGGAVSGVRCRDALHIDGSKHQWLESNAGTT